MGIISLIMGETKTRVYNSLWVSERQGLKNCPAILRTIAFKATFPQPILGGDTVTTWTSLSG